MRNCICFFVFVFLFVFTTVFAADSVATESQYWVVNYNNLSNTPTKLLIKATWWPPNCSIAVNWQTWPPYSHYCKVIKEINSPSPRNFLLQKRLQNNFFKFNREYFRYRTLRRRKNCKSIEILKYQLVIILDIWCTHIPSSYTITIPTNQTSLPAQLSHTHHTFPPRGSVFWLINIITSKNMHLPYKRCILDMWNRMFFLKSFII